MFEEEVFSKPRLSAHSARKNEIVVRLWASDQRVSDAAGGIGIV